MSHDEHKTVALVLSAAESGTLSLYHLGEERGHQGNNELRGRKCYVCGNEDGEARIVLQNSPGTQALNVTVRLKRNRVDLLQRFALDYLLCFECAALVQGLGSYSRPVGHERGRCADGDGPKGVRRSRLATSRRK